jgi:regulator of ribosome biosynthesis
MAKIMPVTLDLGNVALFDLNPLDEVKMSKESNNREEREEYLIKYARDNAQILFDGLYGLPRDEESKEENLVKLPKPTTVLPREKPVKIISLFTFYFL